MKLWEMSISGGILILAIFVLRRLFRNKVPKRTFVILWMVALVRLLVPVSVNAPWSIHTWLQIENWMQEYTGSSAKDWIQEYETRDEESFVQEKMGNEEKNQEQNFQTIWKSLGLQDAVSVWTVIYFGGMLLCAGFYLFTYVKYYGKFQMALPVEDCAVWEWVASFPLRRKVKVRQSDLISTPMTYGILHPVILLPKGVKWENPQQIPFVITHEMVHIQRFDVARKLLFVISVCIHWWNPLVWGMSVLANQDIELACDEGVLQYFGKENKAAYALSLISLAERNTELASCPACRLFGRMVRGSVGNGFGKDAMEERIVAIMKNKKITIGAVTRAGILVIFVIVLFVASGLQKDTKDTREDYVAVEKEQAPIDTQVVRTEKVADLREISGGMIFLPVPIKDPSEISKEWDLDSEIVYEAEEETGLLELYQNICHSKEFPEYEKFGLSYDEDEGHFVYQGEIVGYFKDEIEPGLFRRFTDHVGTIGLVVLRDGSFNMTGFQEKR